MRPVPASLFQAAVLLGVCGSLLLWGAPAPAVPELSPPVWLRGLGLAAALASIVLLLPHAPRAGTSALAALLAFPFLLGGVPALKLPPAGMVLAVYAFAAITHAGLQVLGMARVLAFATGLAACCVLVFAVGLQWPVQVWPTFIGE